MSNVVRMHQMLEHQWPVGKPRVEVARAREEEIMTSYLTEAIQYRSLDRSPPR